jgi:uncharacterized membrane protein YbhN (UPF0104 family)
MPDTLPAARSKTAVKYAVIAAKVAIPLLVVYLLLRNVDWGMSLTYLSRLSVGAILICVAITAFQNLLAAARWWLIIVNLPGERLSFWDSTKYLFASVFVNQTLLSSVGGDGARIWLAYRRGLPALKAVTSVVLDRVVTMLALVLINLASLPLIEWLVPAFPGKFLFVFGLGGLVAGVVALAFLDRMRPLLVRYPWLRQHLAFVKDVRAFLLSPGSVAPPTFNAAFGVFLMTLVAYVLALDLNLNVSFLQCFIFCPAIFLVAALPISIGGWGAREAATILAFGYAGVPREGALVLSVSLGLIYLVGALPGCVFLPAIFSPAGGRPRTRWRRSTMPQPGSPRASRDREQVLIVPRRRRGKITQRHELEPVRRRRPQHVADIEQEDAAARLGVLRPQLVARRVEQHGLARHAEQLVDHREIVRRRYVLDDDRGERQIDRVVGERQRRLLHCHELERLVCRMELRLPDHLVGNVDPDHLAVESRQRVRHASDAAAEVERHRAAELDRCVVRESDAGVEPVASGLEEFVRIPALVVGQNRSHGVALGRATPPIVHFFVRQIHR